MKGKKTKILEIGSNDGFLGTIAKERNFHYIGVDASSHMVTLAKKNNIETLHGLFGKEIRNKLKDRFNSFEIIIANNVLNHSDNLIEFINSVEKLLTNSGTFVFEVPYWLIDFQNNSFDKIYHEHVSYFTFKSLKKLLRNSNLHIVDFEIVKYHGGSLRVYAGRLEQKEINLDKTISNEINTGVFKKQNYVYFMKSIIERRNKFLRKVYELKLKGDKIISIGAAARGNTILNFYKLDSSIIDYVTDVSPFKLSKYTPLSRIKIVEDKIFSEYNKVYAISLTNNINEKVKDILNTYNKHIVYINP